MKGYIKSLDERKLLVFSILFGVFLMLGAGSSYAQERGVDLIYTTKKDTLQVRITEVTLNDIRFKALIGDTALINTIPKYAILKVVYGNGDTDDFSHWTASPTPWQDKRYYQAVPRTAFQREIATWSDERLLMEKARYKNTAIASLIGGITLINVGGVLYVAGLVNTAFDSADVGAPLMIGGTVGVGGGIALAIFGTKNAKKYRVLKTEIGLRGIK